MKIFKNIKGYSLVELTIVILIIGIIFSLLYKYYPRSQQVQQRKVESLNTEYIDDTIVGFAYSHGRLPFPDIDNDGLENVGEIRGTIPEVTLGMAEKPVNRLNIPIEYSIFNKAGVSATDEDDMELAVSKDRLYALLPSGTRTVMPTALNQLNTIDFCFALRTAAKITINDVTSLHVSKTGLPLPLTVYNRNVAYVLVDVGSTDADGDGNLLDGFNTTGLKFEVSTKKHSPEYDDQVNSMEFSELFGSLACGSVISAALHAHDNVVLAADMMHTSFIDYSDLLKLTNELAAADVALAAAAVLQAFAGDADVAGAAATALAESLTPPLTSIGAPAMVEIAISAVLAIAASVAAAATTGFAADALLGINLAIICFDNGSLCAVGTGDFVSKAAALTVTIRENAVDADAAGL